MLATLMCEIYPMVRTSVLSVVMNALKRCLDSGIPTSKHNNDLSEPGFSDTLQHAKNV